MQFKCNLDAIQMQLRCNLDANQMELGPRPGRYIEQPTSKGRLLGVLQKSVKKIEGQLFVERKSVEKIEGQLFLPKKIAQNIDVQLFSREIIV